MPHPPTQDNGIDRFDYFLGTETLRISEVQKNPMLGPAKYSDGLVFTNSMYKATRPGKGVYDQTNPRFPPTPRDPEQEAAAEMMRTTGYIRETPAMRADCKAWPAAASANFKGDRRPMLPETPTPMIRRPISCPPDPDRYLRKGGGIDSVKGTVMNRAHKDGVEDIHDAMRNTVRPGRYKRIDPERIEWNVDLRRSQQLAAWKKVTNQRPFQHMRMYTAFSG